MIEPMLYGKSTGLSPLAVVLSATFWTTLWGPIGLVLATPLTICLVVLGRHVESLKFLDVMFGNRPALSPPEIFYQRMLAEDPAEALDQAEEFLKEKPLAAYYDEVALRGLKLAQIDLDREALDTLHLRRVRDSVIELVKEFDDHDDRITEAQPAQDAETAEPVDSISDTVSPDIPVLQRDELDPDWQSEVPVLCVAGRTGLDEAAAAMLAQLLSKHGLAARVEGPDALSTANIFRLQTKGIAMAVVSFMDQRSAAQMRYTIRRLRRKLPDAPIVLGCWTAENASALAETVKADAVAVTLREAVKLCVERARDAATENDTAKVQTALSA